MRRLALLLLAVPSLAFPVEPTPADRARVALALARAAPHGDDEIPWLPYPDAYEVCIQKNLPLVVFVNQSARTVPGCVSCEVTKFPGADNLCVVVGVPDGAGGIDRVADFYGPANVARIMQAVKDWKAGRAILLQSSVPSMTFRTTARMFGGC